MRYLRRTHQFVTSHASSEVEQQADRYFRALGYKRRADEPRSIAFTRGTRFAGFYAPSLRACRTRVTVEVRKGTRDQDVVILRHKVDILGRIPTGADGMFFDAESRCFEQFLESDETALDLAPLERAYRRIAKSIVRRAIVMIVTIVGVVTFIAAYSASGG